MMINRTVVAFIAGVLLTPLQASADFVGWPGLTDPDVTITFDTFTDEEVLDDQLLSLGVDFNGQFRVESVTFLPNMSGLHLTPAVDVFLEDITYHIDFLTPVSAAGFFLNTRGGFTTFTALLAGQVVESTHLITGENDPTNFYGFEGITFDRISFSIDAADNAFRLDNLQYSFAAVPEPSTLLLLGIAMVGLNSQKRRWSS